MGKNIISVKYEDSEFPHTFRGKDYCYYTNIKLNIGNLVEVPTVFGKKIAKVSRINIPQEEVLSITPYMKSVIRKIDTIRYLNFYEVKEDIS